MNPKNDVPAYISEAAGKRIKETLSEQKEVSKLLSSKTRPMDAEKNSTRKIAYIKRHVGVPDSIAEEIANYTDPKTLPISDEKKSKAESLQGSTVDFMNVVFLDFARAASRCIES